MPVQNYNRLQEEKQHSSHIQQLHQQSHLQCIHTQSKGCIWDGHTLALQSQMQIWLYAAPISHFKKMQAMK